MSGNAMLKAATELREGLAGVAAELAGNGDRGRGVLAERRSPSRRAGTRRRLRGADRRVCAAKRACRSCRSSTGPRESRGRRMRQWRGRVLPDFTYGCHASTSEVDQRHRACAACCDTWRRNDVDARSNPASVRGRSLVPWRWVSARRCRSGSSSRRHRPDGHVRGILIPSGRDSRR